jgi:hypothetical protein
MVILCMFFFYVSLMRLFLRLVHGILLAAACMPVLKRKKKVRQAMHADVLRLKYSMEGVFIYSNAYSYKMHGPFLLVGS